MEKGRRPAVADLRDEIFNGAKYETLGVHQFHAEFPSKTFDKRRRSSAFSHPAIKKGIHRACVLDAQLLCFPDFVVRPR